MIALLIGCGGAAPIAENIASFTGHTDYVCSVALSSNGKQIVSGGADGKIKIWDVESKKCLRTLDGHKEWVQSVALSPDGRSLASGGRDNLVKLWDVETGKQPRVFAGHTGLVKCVAFSPDGRLIASCGRDKFIRIWDRGSGQSVAELNSGDFFTSSVVAFSPDSRLVFFGGDTLQLWDIEKGAHLHTFEGHSDSVGAIAVNSNGRFLASAGEYTDHTIRLWDVESKKQLWSHTFTENTGAWSLIFASEGKVLISGHHDGAHRFWDATSGKELGKAKAHAELISSLSTDRRGEYFVSGGWDRSIKLWKLRSDRYPVHELRSRLREGSTRLIATGA